MYVVNIDPAQAGYTGYNRMSLSLSVTCDRSVVSSTNKTDSHDITEILLKVALNPITLARTPFIIVFLIIDDQLKLFMLQSSS